LPLTGIPVPRDWAEAAAAGWPALVALDRPVLVPSDRSVRDHLSASVHGDRVELVLDGPGGRNVTLIQVPGVELAPPQDPDARAVDVRGHDARVSPNLGELAWIEHGSSVLVRAPALSVDELIGLARALRWTS
jgi:hypothetical protein